MKNEQIKKVTEDQKAQMIEYIERYGNYRNTIKINSEKIKAKEFICKTIEYYVEPKKRTIKLDSYDINSFNEFINECEKKGFIQRLQGTKLGKVYNGGLRTYEVTAIIGITKKQEIINIDNEIKKLEEKRQGLLRTI